MKRGDRPTSAAAHAAWPYVDLRPVVQAPPPLVGREAELEQAIGLLARRTSALVLLVGPTGMGKTTFLRELTTHARGEGWSVADRDDHGELAVTPGTTPGAFDRRLRGLLELTGSLGAETTQLAGDGVRRPGAGVEVLRETRGERQSGLLGKVVSMARRWLTEASWPGLGELVRDLERRAPLLITVDGYCPSEPFGRAFKSAFLAAVGQSPEPIVVLLAEREELLADVEPEADAIVRLGPMDCGRIRRVLAEGSAVTRRPLTDDELDELADAAARRPELIGSMTRLLALSKAIGS